MEMNKKPASRQHLIPGLPDALALRCVARVPREHHPSLKRVSRLWRSALSSKKLYKLRAEMGIGEPWIYVPFFSTRRRSDDEDEGDHRRGGNWIEAYDPKRNSWRRIGMRIPGVGEHEILRGFGVAVVGKRIFVIGGRVCSRLREEVRISREVYSLDCVTAKWSRCSSMALPRADFACVVRGELVYVAGGLTDTWPDYRGSSGVAAAEVFSPRTNSWQALPRMNIGRYRCAGVAQASKVHVIGGFAEGPPEVGPSGRGVGPRGRDVGPRGSPVYALERSSVDVLDTELAAPRWDLLKGMWQLDVPPYQIVAMADRLYSSGDVLNPWKGRLEVYDPSLNLWKIVEGSQQLLSPPGGGWELRYLTMAPMPGSAALLFLAGYLLRSSSSSDPQQQQQQQRPMLVEAASIFDTAAKRWSYMEPLVADNPFKDIGSHCCTVSL